MPQIDRIKLNRAFKVLVVTECGVDILNPSCLKRASKGEIPRLSEALIALVLASVWLPRPRELNSLPIIRFKET
jgi:hypothetical protein